MDRLGTRVRATSRVKPRAFKVVLKAVRLCCVHDQSCAVPLRGNAGAGGQSLIWGRKHALTSSTLHFNALHDERSSRNSHLHSTSTLSRLHYRSRGNAWLEYNKALSILYLGTTLGVIIEEDAWLKHATSSTSAALHDYLFGLRHLELYVILQQYARHFDVL